MGLQRSLIMLRFKEYLKEQVISEAIIKDRIKYFDSQIKAIKKMGKEYSKYQTPDTNYTAKFLKMKNALRAFVDEFDYYLENVLDIEYIKLKKENTSKFPNTHALMSRLLYDYANDNDLAKWEQFADLKRVKVKWGDSKYYDWFNTEESLKDMKNTVKMAQGYYRLNLYSERSVLQLEKVWREFKKEVKLSFDINDEEMSSIGVHTLSNKNWKVSYIMLDEKSSLKNTTVLDKSFNSKTEQEVSKTIDIFEKKVIPYFSKHYPYMLNQAIDIVLQPESSLSKGADANRKVNNIYKINLMRGSGANERTIVHEMGHLIKFEHTDNISEKSKMWEAFYKNRYVPFESSLKAVKKKEIDNIIKKTKYVAPELDKKANMETSRYIRDAFSKVEDDTIYQIMRTLPHSHATDIQHFTTDYRYDIDWATLIYVPDSVSEKFVNGDESALINHINSHIDSMKRIISKNFISGYANKNEEELFAELFTTVYMGLGNISGSTINMFKYVSGYK